VVAFTALCTLHATPCLHPDPWRAFLACPQVVSDALLDAAKSMAASRRPDHAHSYLPYPFRVELFAEDMAAIAKANPIVAMRLGYKILAAMTEMVIGDKQLLQQFRELKPDLIIGDATAAYGHWLSSLLGVPAIEFDVGTSSGLLHSMWGGQVNPSYIPASGGCASG